MTASGAGPAEHRNGELGHDEGRAALGGQRVLIVEDDAHATHLLEELLKAVGYEVMTTDSALGTAGLVRRVRPSVILLDLGLPYRSGVSLLADLKSDPTTAEIPILAVTGYPEMLTNERRSMVVDVIAKPFESRALLDAVGALCDASG